MSKEKTLDPATFRPRERLLYEAAKHWHSAMWGWRWIALVSAALNLWLAAIAGVL